MGVAEQAARDHAISLIRGKLMREAREQGLGLPWAERIEGGLLHLLFKDKSLATNVPWIT